MKSMIIKNIPDSVKREFKKLCISSDITIREGIIKLMEYAISNKAIPGVDRMNNK
jgi:phage terminase Nu1 subunit (DNA packaging protein)